MARVETTGLSRAQVLAALFNRSKPQGLGALNPNAARELSVADAQGYLDVGGDRGKYDFDYLKGRVLKVDLTDESGFDPRLFDRDNGEGAAQRAIDGARQLARYDAL